MTIETKITVALGRLNVAIQQHQPIAVFGLFSGGHDSFCAAYVASLHPSCVGIVHINTGIGIEATRDYVRTTCRDRGWRLIEYRAKENVNAKGEPDPQDYAQIVLKHGFPGPAGHSMMYARLKQRALQRLERDWGADCRKKVKKRVLLVSGCRQQESTRRMGNTQEVQIDGRRIWVAPILDWSKTDTSLCLEHVAQPRSEVVDLIHKSGECLCGAFAKPGELEELNMWPITRPAYERIKALQVAVRMNGKNWDWGQRPPRKCDAKQLQLPGPLCHSCYK